MSDCPLVTEAEAKMTINSTFINFIYRYLVKLENLKGKIGIFLLIASFLLNLITSGISNYSLNSLLIKIIAGIISGVVILFFFKNELKELLRTIKKSAVLFSVMFILYMSVSLLWSSNPDFGAEKVIHFVIGNETLVLSIGVILGIKVVSRQDSVGSRQNSVGSRQDSVGSGQDSVYSQQSSVGSGQLAVGVVITGVIACCNAILLDPFNPSIPYSFEITRWSHVAFGRFTGLALLITYLYYQNSDNRKRKLSALLLILLFTYSIISSGYRGGLIAAILVISADSFYRIIRHPEIRLTAIIHCISIAVIVFLSFVIMSWNNGKMERWKNLTVLADNEVIVDQSINSRIEAYSVAWRMFKENPLTGSGLGSFNGSNYGSEIGRIIKYPHNIILELLCELGLIGLGFLIVYIGAIIRILLKWRKDLLIIFVFGILLAMFGKDIGSNGLVWVFVGVGARAKERS